MHGSKGTSEHHLNVESETKDDTSEFYTMGTIRLEVTWNLRYLLVEDATGGVVVSSSRA